MCLKAAWSRFRRGSTERVPLIPAQAAFPHDLTSGPPFATVYYVELNSGISSTRDYTGIKSVARALFLRTGFATRKCGRIQDIPQRDTTLRRPISYFLWAPP